MLMHLSIAMLPVPASNWAAPQACSDFASPDTPKDLSMRSPLFCGLSLCLLCLFCATAPAQQGKAVAVWLTTADRSSLLAHQGPSLQFQKHAADQASTIQVDDSKTFQSLDGFGFALTGGSAELLMKMDKVKRHELLQELFSRGPNAVGVSYLRVSIGASDMNDHVFTY